MELTEHAQHACHVLGGQKVLSDATAINWKLLF
jgi:hypothetical protein